ncbi:MAG: hypothetical protein ACRDHZ_19780 [Ktedonobacteraceae bacterium]
MSISEIALFRAGQTLEEEAAQRGYTGLAQVAQHDFINARATRGAQRILQLVEQGQHVQAIALMEQPHWGEPEDEEPK